MPSRTVAIEIYSFAIHWYGIMYLIAFGVSWFLLPRLQYLRKLKLTKDEWSTCMTYGVLGVIIGGRLGYVFLYDLPYFLLNPGRVFYIWEGGMASHGGMAGVLIALLFFSRTYRVPFLSLMDVVVIPAAIGLAIGRIGNAINMELYGFVTTLPWGIEIPGVAGLRHPTQIYAVFSNLIISVLLFLHLSKRLKRPHGITAALFLIIYGVARFLLEFLRVPTHNSFEFWNLTLTRGQLYSVVMVVIGLLLTRVISKIPQLQQYTAAARTYGDS